MELTNVEVINVFTNVYVGVDYGESLNCFKREWENHHRLEE